MGDEIIKAVVERLGASLLFQSLFSTFLISLFTLDSKPDKHTSLMTNTVSSASKRVSKSEALVRLFTWNENKVGPRMDLCGTPVDILSKCEDTLLI